MRRNTLRELTVQDAAHESWQTKLKRSEHGTHVAELRCRKVTCRAKQLGIRTPDEAPNVWELAKCVKCGTSRPKVVHEFEAETEWNPDTQAMRYRRKGGTQWFYLPVKQEPAAVENG